MGTQPQQSPQPPQQEQPQQPPQLIAIQCVVGFPGESSPRKIYPIVTLRTIPIDNFTNMLIHAMVHDNIISSSDGGIDLTMARKNDDDSFTVVTSLEPLTKNLPDVNILVVLVVPMHMSTQTPTQTPTQTQ